MRSHRDPKKVSNCLLNLAYYVASSPERSFTYKISTPVRTQVQAQARKAPSKNATPPTTAPAASMRIAAPLDVVLVAADEVVEVPELVAELVMDAVSEGVVEGEAEGG